MGPMQQRPILLAGLSLIFLTGYSRAKYMLKDIDDGIGNSNLKFGKDKGIYSRVYFISIENGILSNQYVLL